jgi:hypothetical protein
LYFTISFKSISLTFLLFGSHFAWEQFFLTIRALSLYITSYVIRNYNKNIIECVMWYNKKIYSQAIAQVISSVATLCFEFYLYSWLFPSWVQDLTHHAVLTVMKTFSPLHIIYITYFNETFTTCLQHMHVHRSAFLYYSLLSLYSLLLITLQEKAYSVETSPLPSPQPLYPSLRASFVTGNKYSVHMISCVSTKKLVIYPRGGSRCLKTSWVLLDSLNRGRNPRMRYSQALALGKGPVELRKTVVRLAGFLVVTQVKYCLNVN